MPAATSVRTTSPKRTVPRSGRSIPAMTARHVLLPAPDGPKRTVTPAAHSNATWSRWPPGRSSVTSTEREPSGTADTARELVDRIEEGDRHGGEHGGHPRCGPV